MTQLRRTTYLLALSLGCGGNSRQGSGAPGGAGSQSPAGSTEDRGGGGLGGGGLGGAAGGISTAAPRCPGEIDTSYVPAATCAAETSHCMTEGADASSCAFNSLSLTMRSLAAACGIYCGDASLGLTDHHCIASINPRVLGVSLPQTAEQALACLEQRLIGTRWDCAPDQGWVRVYLGSCTIP